MIPQEVREAVREVCKRNNDDATKQIGLAIDAVRALPSFSEWVQTLVDAEIQTLVYAERRNKPQASADRVTRAEGDPSMGREMLAAAFSGIYDTHRIGGTVLGNITFEQIPAIVDRLRSSAGSLNGQAAFLLWCQKQGGEGKQRIRDVIPEAKSTKRFDAILEKYRAKKLEAVEV